MFALNYSLMLMLLYIINNCFHIGDHGLIQLLHPLEITLDKSISYTPKMLAKYEVTGTIGSIMHCNLCFSSYGTELLL